MQASPTLARGAIVHADHTLRRAVPGVCTSVRHRATPSTARRSGGLPGEIDSIKHVTKHEQNLWESCGRPVRARRDGSITSRLTSLPQEKERSRQIAESFQICRAELARLLLLGKAAERARLKSKAAASGGGGSVAITIAMPRDGPVAGPAAVRRPMVILAKCESFAFN